MKNLLILPTFIIILSCHSLFSQNHLPGNGILRGIVVDEVLSTPLQNTPIFINSKFITKTGVDGKFIIDSLTEGKYTIEFRYIGYHDKVFENIEVKKGEINNLTVRLKQHEIEDCHEKYFPGIDEIFISYKKCCEKAFGVKEIEESHDYIRIYVFPSFQWEYLIEMKMNDSEHGIKLFIVDSTDINISYDKNELFYVDSAGKEHVEQYDADYSDNTYSIPDCPYHCIVRELKLEDYNPTVRIKKYNYNNDNFYKLILSKFELMRIDTMQSIEYCNLVFTDGTSIIVETNINNNINRFYFHADSGYNDKRYVWISNLATELKEILVNKK